MSSIDTKKSGQLFNSSNLTDNLIYLMRKKEVDVTELSKSTGIAATTINGLKKGIGNPTLSTLQSLADFFETSIGELTEKPLSNSKLRFNLVEIPLVEMQEIQDFLLDIIKFERTITVEAEKNSKLFAVKINNNSMAPHFEKGTIFVILYETTPQDGDIVLVQFNNQIPCFRRIFMEDESCIFSPVSEMIGAEVFKSKNFILHGLVTKAIQNFHE